MNWWLLRRRIHVSWIIMIGSLSFVLGVWVAQYVQSPSLSVAVTAGLVAGIVLWRRSVYLLPLLIVVSVIIGIGRGTLTQLDSVALTSLQGSVIVIQGNVREDIDSDGSGKIAMRLNQLTYNNTSIGGVIWISSHSDVDIKRGDTITIKGTLLEGFGTFNGVMYRADIQHVERPYPGDVARVFRDWFADTIRLAIPQPEASLGIGYLVGQKRALPADLIMALQIAGLTHVVVASGYNLTILVRLARRLFEKISKYLSMLSASIMIGGFVAVTGFSPSMSRAGLVAGLSLAAWYYGRRFHPILLLSLVMAITVAINPSYAWGDLGWQLSFAAFGGVMILAPLLQRFFFGEAKPGIIRQIFGETLSAVIVTAPILIGAFGQFSNVALIANMLVLPLVPLAMLLTFIAGIGALVFPAWAMIIGLPATWLLGYMIGVARYMSALPWASTTIEFSPWMVSVCYVVIIGVCVWLWRITKYDLRNANIVE
jgi:competence protein ComEC